MHAWSNGARVVAVDDAGVDQIMQMADEHPLRLHWLRASLLVVLFVLSVIGA